MVRYDYDCTRSTTCHSGQESAESKALGNTAVAMLRRSRCIQIFFKHHECIIYQSRFCFEISYIIVDRMLWRLGQFILTTIIISSIPRNF